MHVAFDLAVLAVAVIAFSEVSRRLSLSAPLVLVAVGLVASYLPFVPTPTLQPEVVLVGILPPLLYAAAIRTSLIDFRRNKRPILLLSVGLVVFTTVGVGLLVWWVLPVPLAAGFALGTIVAPPDAVAAIAIARRVGMPRRVVTILEGESLVNDATALVGLRTAIAAMSGAVSVQGVAGGFVLSALGGIAVGMVVAVVVGRIRSHIGDDLSDVAVSLLTPWVAYLPAEEIHSSGVLAVVVAGLLLGHKSPVIQSATSRVFERTNWATISYLLENGVFLLIGMQVRSVVQALDASRLSTPHIAGVAGLTLVAVIGLRLVWVYPATYLPRLIPAVGRADPKPPWPIPLMIGWAGMRGVVTLAAVFLLPADMPLREVFVAIAFVVTAGTLLLQGLTLPWLVRRLGVAGPDPAEDNLQRASVTEQASQAGLAELDDALSGDEPQEVVDRLRRRSIDRSNAVWERLGTQSETPSLLYVRLREQMLRAEREEVLRVRGLGTVDQQVLREVLDALDLEETVLDRVAASTSSAERETELRPAANHDACEHLQAYEQVPTPRTPSGCEECLRDGTSWVHLRLCMACGHVGCCDSSPQVHSDRHWRECEHPVMRSFETGEAWRWCYEHQLLG